MCTDMYLPAFDQMHIDLNTSKSSISYTLSVFLFGFAVAQLLWGPIADKKGNKTAILYGLFLFALTSLLIFFVENVVLLLVLRIFQAIGACAATVCWQSLVIERYPKEATNKIFSSIMPLVALSPAIAPIIGAFLLEKFGWRSIFLLLFIVAGLLMVYTFFLKNTTEKKDEAKSPKVIANYFSFFKSKAYVGNVVIYGFCSAAFFAWLTGAPFFLKSLGYDATEIGFSFIPQTITFMVGGYGLRLALNKIEGKKILPFVLLIYAVSIVGVVAVVFLTQPTLTTLLIPFSIMAMANGACYPIVVNDALNLFPNASGKASALQNTLQLGICFVGSGIVSLFTSNALLATAFVMLFTLPFIGWGYIWSKK